MPLRLAGDATLSSSPVHPIWLIILAPLSFLAFPMMVAIPIAVLAVLVLFFKHDGDED